MNRRQEEISIMAMTTLRTANVGDQKVGLERYAVYIFDSGAPVGLRLALRHPERTRIRGVRKRPADDRDGRQTR